MKKKYTKKDGSSNVQIITKLNKYKLNSNNINICPVLIPNNNINIHLREQLFLIVCHTISPFLSYLINLFQGVRLLLLELHDDKHKKELFN